VDGKSIYMHKTLVANVSKSLDRLINGFMSEAQSGEAELEEVDGLTFTRFCQWAYAGFYPAAEFGDRPQDVALAEQTGMLNLYRICTLGSRFPQLDLPRPHPRPPFRLQ